MKKLTFTDPDDALVRGFLESPQGRRYSNVFDRYGIGVRDLLVDVRSAARARARELGLGDFWKAQDLCGEYLWQRLNSPGGHRLLGLCLSYLVERGEVPVQCVIPQGSGRTKQYAPKTGL